MIIGIRNRLITAAASAPPDLLSDIRIVVLQLPAISLYLDMKAAIPMFSPSSISRNADTRGNQTCSASAIIPGNASSSAVTWVRIRGNTSSSSNPMNRNVSRNTLTTAIVRGSLSFCRRSASGSPMYASNPAATNGVSTGASKYSNQPNKVMAINQLNLLSVFIRQSFRTRCCAGPADSRTRRNRGH